MVFKATSNVSSAILQPLWTSADTLNEDNTEVLSPSSFPREHYKNRFIQNWQTADPKEVGVLHAFTVSEHFPHFFRLASCDRHKFVAFPFNTVSFTLIYYDLSQIQTIR